MMQPGRAARTLATAFALVSSTSAAQTPATAPAATSSREDAYAHFVHGNELFEAGDPSRALAEFQRSFELHPARATMKNMALCLERLERYEEALELLEALPKRFPLPEKERQDYEAKLRELGQRVSYLELRGLDPGFRVSIDGRACGTTPLESELRLSAGSHRLHLERPGRASIDDQLDLEPGQHGVWHFRASSGGDSPEPPPGHRAKPAIGAQPTPPVHRLRLGLELAGALSPSLAGEVAACSADCDRSVAFGGRVSLELSVARSEAWELWLRAGLLRVGQHVTRPIGAVVGLGPDELSGTASDDVTTLGGFAGMNAEYTFDGFARPFLRFGAGAWVTQVRDTRDARLRSASGSNYRIEQSQSEPSVAALASLGAGFGFGESAGWQFGAGADLSAGYVIVQPKWREEPHFGIEKVGYGWFPEETLASRGVFIVLPFVRVRYSL